MNAPAGRAPAAISRIGPNAITRVAEVLTERLGSGATRHLFMAAGLAPYLEAPPQEMVDEVQVMRLHAALRGELDRGLWQDVARSAGERTADYLLRRRIPAAVQAVLKRLPAPVAARVLLHAIRRHAWTFSGSGRFSARAGCPVVLEIRGNPLCRGIHDADPVCSY